MKNRLNIVRVLARLLVMAATCSAWQQNPSPEVRQAMAALQGSDFQTAERMLRAAVAAHPDDAWALSLLGAALDSLRRFPEADAFHTRAVAKAPRSTEVLINYAAHLWLGGAERESATVYRQVVALDPAHYNANLQLARLALKERNGPEALRCLDRLATARREAPVALLPRLEALYLSGDRTQADALAGRLEEMAKADRNLGIAAGMALTNVEQFARAESLFEIALQQDPANFNLLYDTGVAATRAGHNNRAREVLETALQQQPRNVNVLYALAYADHALKQWETAVHLLSQAAKLEPQRADVQKMLALATTDMGALEDALAAWDRYLKLQPGDAIGRRERGYTAAQKGQLEEGVADLEWFVAQRPDDAVGHYELGQALRTLDMAKALDQFDQALTLDPNYVPARMARGSLYYQEGKPEVAVRDLEIAAASRPDDPTNLDRLGQTYQALDHSADAVRVLRKAAGLAPADSKILLHFARALADSGNTAESKTVMDRFRELGPEKKTGVRGGFVEYLSLTDDERHADYRARLENALRSHPDDATLHVEHLKLLLGDGELERAAAAARGMAAMKPGAALLADAGRALLAAKQYALANELLQQAKTAGSPPGIELDLAMASGNSSLALRALEQAIEATPERSDLYRQAAALLVGEGRADEAARLLDRAARTLARDREILLLRAAAAELAGKTDDAEHWLGEVQSRWPEWHPAWAAHGMVLATHRHCEEARRALETAVALGASGPGVYYYLADCALQSGPGERDAAEKAIGQALRLSPADPWIQDLAGRIALARKDHDLARERLREAVRLRPESVQAHRDLAGAYRAAGRAQEAQSEWEEAGRLEKNGHRVGGTLPYLPGLFSAVPGYLEQIR